MAKRAEPQSNGKAIRGYIARMRRLARSVSERNRKIHSKTQESAAEEEPATPSKVA